MKLIKTLIVLINLIVIIFGEHIEYQSYNSLDKIFVKSLDNNKLTIKEGIKIENDNNLIISHSQSSKYKRDLFSSELFKRDNTETQDNIESITIYFNNNNLNGLFSKKQFTSDLIDSSLSTFYHSYDSVPSTSSTPFIKYPIVLEPVINVLVKFKDGSNEIKMEHYSTIKTLTFNQTYSICKILESVLDMSLQPCSSKESPVFENFLHMGLVPDHLSLPFLQADLVDFNDNSKVSSDSNSGRLRFLQSSKFNLSDDEYYSPLLNSKSLLNCLSVFNNNKLCSSKKVNYLIENQFSQLLGYTLEIKKDTIHFNEMALFSKDNQNNQNINIKYIKDKSHLNNDPEQKHSTQIILINNNEKEMYQLDNSKLQLLGKDIINQQESQQKQQIQLWNIVKLERSIKKSGFHRELFTNITIKSPSTLKIPRQCKLLLLEHFDQGIFVDRYEVDEIERFGGAKVNIYQLIDLEKPSATSTQNYISIVKQFTVNTELEENIQISLPIHLRYQNPINSNNDAFRSTHISSPSVFIQCEPTNSIESSQILNHWNQITSFSNNFNHTKSLFIDVPVGQLNDLEKVRFNTLTVTVIGSILVILTIIFTQRKLIKEKSKIK